MKPGIKARHDKQRSKMGQFLHEYGYTLAADALAYAQELDLGETRKDGETPSFHHQLSIARLLFTLRPHLRHPEETLAAAFLHDVMEDHSIGGLELADRFGRQVTGAVWRLTKRWDGMAKPYDRYFGEMSGCPIASVVKLADRAHNIQTMIGVFDRPKQRMYLTEVTTWFFPLLRSARRQHPDQYDAYENLKILLRCQVTLLRLLVGASHG